MYGDIDPATGVATPARRDRSLGHVLRVGNGSGDQSFVATLQLDRRLTAGAGIMAAYTFTKARDRFSSVMDDAGEDLGGMPVDGTLRERRRATSVWSLPHKLTLIASADLPFHFRGSLFYVGTSGSPFTYVVAGDANGDGFGDALQEGSRGNDIVYVPRGPADITLADPAEYPMLELVIARDACLARSRGHVSRRNGCRNPWLHTSEARIARFFALPGGRPVEISVDAFNLLHLVNAHWGLVRGTSAPGVPLLQLTGYDVPNDRGVYRVLPVDAGAIDLGASRWRLQLGARYAL
jgi:hypothetical protein